jgi:hypothetical protein
LLSTIQDVQARAVERMAIRRDVLGSSMSGVSCPEDTIACRSSASDTRRESRTNMSGAAPAFAAARGLQSRINMGIAIRPSSGVGGIVKGDSWLDALTKLVPGEVIIGFTGALQVGGVEEDRNAHLAILIIFTCLAPLVLWWSARRAQTDVHWLQYVIRTGAFVLYGLGSDHLLIKMLGGMHWIPGVGAFVVALLAALVLAPPGTQS